MAKGAFLLWRWRTNLLTWCLSLFSRWLLSRCLQKAVTERGLEDLIRQARKENPFPFDHQRQSDPRANNPPFPFPVARD